MMEIMLLIFGGRKARQAYREHTQAIIDHTAAVRALNNLRREHAYNRARGVTP